MYLQIISEIIDKLHTVTGRDKPPSGVDKGSRISERIVCKRNYNVQTPLVANNIDVRSSGYFALIIRDEELTACYFSIRHRKKASSESLYVFFFFLINSIGGKRGIYTANSM